MDVKALFPTILRPEQRFLIYEQQGDGASLQRVLGGAERASGNFWQEREV